MDDTIDYDAPFSIEDLMTKARVAPEYIRVVAKYTCRELPLLWLQKPTKDLNSSNVTI